MVLNNQTLRLDHTLSTRSIADTLVLIQQRYLSHLPLVIIILGLVGFIGNLFTFLQPTLRTNSFCIYTLSASFIDIINLFLNLFPLCLNPSVVNLVLTMTDSLSCKLKLFSVVFFPQLSLNLLIMSLIDRYACTFSPASRMYRLCRLKMVPLMIILTIIISGTVSLYSPPLYDFIPDVGCSSTYPTINAVFYILIHGLMTPTVMLVLMFLTYGRFTQNRRRVGAVIMRNKIHVRNQFIATVFAQVLVSSLFILQWIVMYWYFLATSTKNKTTEEWTIIYFVFNLTNTLYYVINVKSFYLSTLTSRLFRETMILGFLKILPGNLHRRWSKTNNAFMMTNPRKSKSEATVRRKRDT